MTSDLPSPSSRLAVHSPRGPQWSSDSKDLHGRFGSFSLESGDFNDFSCSPTSGHWSHICSPNTLKSERSFRYRGKKGAQKSFRSFTGTLRLGRQTRLGSMVPPTRGTDRRGAPSPDPDPLGGVYILSPPLSPKDPRRPTLRGSDESVRGKWGYWSQSELFPFRPYIAR